MSPLLRQNEDRSISYRSRIDKAVSKRNRSVCGRTGSFSSKGSATNRNGFRLLTLNFSGSIPRAQAVVRPNVDFAHFFRVLPPNPAAQRRSFSTNHHSRTALTLSPDRTRIDSCGDGWFSPSKWAPTFVGVGCFVRFCRGKNRQRRE